MKAVEEKFKFPETQRTEQNQILEGADHAPVNRRVIPRLDFILFVRVLNLNMTKQFAGQTVENAKPLQTLGDGL
jgi:hypothetical protein